MRRIVLTVTLVVWTSQVDAAILFTPTNFTLDLSDAIFEATGTDTYCWQCSDADPSNDLLAVLEDFPVLSDSGDQYWFSYQGAAGNVRIQGTATSFAGFNGRILIRATLSASSVYVPETLANPSVSFGILDGNFLGVNDGGIGNLLVLNCCGGAVGPVMVQPANLGELFRFIPPGGLLERENMELHFPELIEYTPVSAVPEPTTLLLFGSALAAAALRRRRAKTRNF